MGFSVTLTLGVAGQPALVGALFTAVRESAAWPAWRTGEPCKYLRKLPHSR